MRRTRGCGVGGGMCACWGAEISSKENWGYLEDLSKGIRRERVKKIKRGHIVN